MDELIELNQKFFQSCGQDCDKLESLWALQEHLKKHSIINIRGLSMSKKLESVYGVLELENKIAETLYFHPDQYTSHQIQKSSSLQKYIDVAEQNQDISVIILEDVCNIHGIKSLIKDLYSQKKYQIIIICNGKAFKDIPNYLLPHQTLDAKIIWELNPAQFQNYRKLGNLHDFDYNNDLQANLSIRDAFVDSIILHDLLLSYGVKDIYMLRLFLSFLSRNIWKYISIREIHQVFEKSNAKISLITLHDYLQIALNVGVIQKLHRYNFKKNTISESKGTYYFADIGMRSHFRKNTSWIFKSVIENIIVSDLIQKSYDLHTGVNWTFEFSFYIQKWEKKILAHVYVGGDKKEFKKDLRKLEKIEFEADKYIIVDEYETLALRKKNYDSVKLITWREFLLLM